MEIAEDKKVFQVPLTDNGMGDIWEMSDYLMVLYS